MPTTDMTVSNGTVGIVRPVALDELLLQVTCELDGQPGTLLLPQSVCDQIAPGKLAAFLRYVADVIESGGSREVHLERVTG